MNKESFLLGLALGAAGCAGDKPPTESTPLHEGGDDADGTGGATDSPTPTDLELLEREHTEIARLAVDDVLLSDYLGSCELTFNPAEEDAAQAWVVGDQLQMVDLFTLDDRGNDVNWAVVAILAEACDSFSDIEALRSPDYISTPYSISELDGVNRYDVSFEFGHGSSEGDYAAMMIPFTYVRRGNDVDVQGAVRHAVIACIEDGEIDWIEVLGG